MRLPVLSNQLTSKTKSHEGSLVHYYLPQPSIDTMAYTPHMYFEAKIDFVDVRSGLRRSCSVSHAMEICETVDDSVWTEDMVTNVSAEDLLAGIPPCRRLQEMPATVDAVLISRNETRFLQYLLRYYCVKLYRNFPLNISPIRTSRVKTLFADVWRSWMIRSVGIWMSCLKCSRENLNRSKNNT